MFVSPTFSGPLISATKLRLLTDQVQTKWAHTYIYTWTTTLRLTVSGQTAGREGILSHRVANFICELVWPGGEATGW